MISKILLLILLNKPSLEPFYAARLASTMVKYAREYSVPAEHIAAIAFIESSYRVRAVRADSDFGLMQINNAVHKLDRAKLLTMDYNIKHGTRIYAWFYRRYGKDAVARYNCGLRKGCIKWESVLEYVERFNKALRKRCK